MASGQYSPQGYSPQGYSPQVYSPQGVAVTLRAASPPETVLGLEGTASRVTGHLLGHVQAVHLRVYLETLDRSETFNLAIHRPPSEVSGRRALMIVWFGTVSGKSSCHGRTPAGIPQWSLQHTDS